MVDADDKPSGRHHEEAVPPPRVVGIEEKEGLDGLEGESTTMPVMMHMRRWRAIGRVRGERRGRVSVATLVRRIRMVGRIHRGWRQLVMRWVRALWAWRWGNNRNTARHGLGLA